MQRPWKSLILKTQTPGRATSPWFRMLVQLCKTLDEVPKERYLFCRLAYHDNVPEDYEPQFFRFMDASELGHFPRKPFTM